jgi:hypothetical protein
MSIDPAVICGTFRIPPSKSKTHFMKKFALPAVRLMIPAFFLFIFGCNKLGSLPSQTLVADLCAIKSLSFVNGGGIDTITFLYDALGRPVNSIRAFVGTGSPRYVFRYDSEGRLQDFIGAYGDTGDYGGEFWTRYAYSGDNRTVWDTTYIFPEGSIWPPANYLDFRSTMAKYDDEGRVIQTTTYIPPVNFFDTTAVYGESFVYDAKGDVEGFTYDDKINLHRTNKVWQFIDFQYSAHNPTKIDAYNAMGLPVKINFTPGGGTVMLGLAFANTVISYDCELPKGQAQGD